MTKEQARALINPKLLSDDLIVLGDGEKVRIPVTDEKIEANAKWAVPFLERKDKEKGA